MSGRPTSERLRDVAARWREYGPTNTEVGMLCTPTGACAQGDILLVEGGYRRAPHPISKFLELYHDVDGWVTGGADDEVAELLGIDTAEAGTIRVLNDRHGKRPVEYVELLADRYEARERILAAAEMVVGA